MSGGLGEVYGVEGLKIIHGDELTTREKAESASDFEPILCAFRC